MVLRKGNDPNILKLAVETLDIKPDVILRGGLMETSLIISFTHYSIDDLLCQLLDEYGEEELNKKIKSLQ